MGKSRPSSYIRHIVFILLPILFWGLYWYVGFPHVIEKACGLLVAVICVSYFFVYIIPHKTPRNSYDYLLKSFLIITFISILNAFVFWGQNPALTFSVGYGIYIYMYFFLFEKFKISNKQIIDILKVFVIIYALLWLYAFSKAPVTVFGNAEEISDDRGLFRIAIEGLPLVVLYYFYSLSRLLKDRGFNWKLVTTIVCFLLIFASMSRMVIVTVLLVSAFLIIKRKSIVAIVLIAGIIYFGAPYISKIPAVEGLIELQRFQSENTEDSDKLFRDEYHQCYELFPLNPITILLGNGHANLHSSYGQREEKLKSDYRFHREDAGYPGLYLNYGLLSLFLFVVIFYRALSQKVPEDYIYFKAFVIYFVITNITSYNFEMSNGLALSIALYSLEMVRNKDIEYGK